MRRLRRIILWLLSVAVAVFLIVAWPGCNTLTVSPDTTYVTGPPDGHGGVDYAAALNERLGRGVTPENNAVVLFWRALGPTPEGQRLGNMAELYRAWLASYFELLGTPPPAEADEHFVSWNRHATKGLDKEDISADERFNRQRALFDRLDRATQWPWTSKEQPDLAAWLKEVEKPLALVVEASRRPGYFNPIIPPREGDWSAGLIETKLDHVHRWRPLYQALIGRAMLHVGERRFDDAWADLLACHRLARLVASGATLIELFFGIATERQATAADLVLLTHADVWSSRVAGWLRDFQQLAPMPSVADQADHFERLMLLDILLKTAEQGLPYLDGLANDWKPPKGNRFVARLFTRSVNWDPAFRDANRWFDRIAATLRIPDRPRRERELAALIDELKALHEKAKSIKAVDKFLLGPNGRGEMMGDVMIPLMLPAFQKVHWADERAEQLQDNLQIAFALAAYRADHRRYPPGLDELAPKYLAKVPDDHFTGGPLIYRPAADSYFLNSVGPNGRDDDGRIFGDDPPGDDIAVRMPAAPPRDR